MNTTVNPAHDITIKSTTHGPTSHRPRMAIDKEAQQLTHKKIFITTRSSCYHTHMQTDQPIFPELFPVRLLQVRPVSKTKLLGTAVAEFDRPEASKHWKMTVFLLFLWKILCLSPPMTRRSIMLLSARYIVCSYTHTQTVLTALLHGKWPPLQQFVCMYFKLHTLLPFFHWQLTHLLLMTEH